MCVKLHPLAPACQRHQAEKPRWIKLSSHQVIKSIIVIKLSSYQVNLYSYQVICTSSLRISAQVIGSLDLVCLLGIWTGFFPSLSLWL